MRINLGELNLPLDDPRREKFAQERAYGMSAYHSYIAAGYQANGGNCNRMNDRPDVQRRIQEIKKVAGHGNLKVLLFNEFEPERC